jgi:hypothetical protein
MSSIYLQRPGQARRDRDSHVRDRMALTVRLLFLASALAACGSSGSPQQHDTSVDGPSLDGATQPDGAGDGATCRAPTAAYGPSTQFETALNAPQPQADCPLACGDSMWEPSLLGLPNVDVALPYGACAATTPACGATARVPCTCPNAQGPVHGFVCTCESGSWVCRIRVAGTAACLPCDGGAD